jgi:nucleoside-diphosphate-sugar epimerase
MRPVSIIGCGYTGVRLARRLRARGYRVRGLATREQSLHQIADAGADAEPLDLDAPFARLDFGSEVLYYMVPPAREGARDERLERLLAGLAGEPARIVYLSTTGVYGDHGGALVDEDTAPAPRSERAVRRVAAEHALRAWAQARSVSWCILRVPGIYGPGRLPIERLRRRQPAIFPQEAPPGNRIHVEDLVSACFAAGFSARADRRIYNVTDGSADSFTAYLQRVARIGNLPPPPLIHSDEARASPDYSQSFLGESRRVDNRRMLEELGIELAYCDLDKGIRDSL